MSRQIRRSFVETSDLTVSLNELRPTTDGPAPTQSLHGTIDWEHIDFHNADARTQSTVFRAFNPHPPASQRVSRWTLELGQDDVAARQIVTTLTKTKRGMLQRGLDIPTMYFCHPRQHMKHVSTCQQPTARGNQLRKTIIMGKLNIHYRLGIKPSFSEIVHRYCLSRRTVDSQWKRQRGQRWPQRTLERVQSSQEDRQGRYTSLGVAKKAVREFLLRRRKPQPRRMQHVRLLLPQTRHRFQSSLESESRWQFKAPPTCHLQFDC